MRNTKKIPVSEAIIKIRTFCNYRDRCHKEVRDKLYNMGLWKKEVDDVLMQMIDEDLLNEERFARSFARGYFRTKRWGKLRIKMELRQRLIHDRLIDTAMEEIDDKAYLETIQYLIQKKDNLLQGSSHKERRFKIINYMRSKGYTYDEVLEPLKELNI